MKVLTWIFPKSLVEWVMTTGVMAIGMLVARFAGLDIAILVMVSHTVIVGVARTEALRDGIEIGHEATMEGLAEVLAEVKRKGGKNG